MQATAAQKAKEGKRRTKVHTLFSSASPQQRQVETNQQHDSVLLRYWGIRFRDGRSFPLHRTEPTLIFCNHADC